MAATPTRTERSTAPGRRHDRRHHRRAAGKSRGLTGVWAEENTRASIWDAMYRKETFGVSGPHIKVRFFGGWGYDKDIVGAKRLGEAVLCRRRAHGRGSAPHASTKGTAPTFVVWAVKDPTSANLDRIQVIKGWTRTGRASRRFSTSRGRVTASPTSGPAGFPRSRARWTSEKATYDKHRRLDRTEDGLDGSGIRSQPPRVLLRARAGDSDAALDPHSGRQSRAAAA